MLPVVPGWSRRVVGDVVHLARPGVTVRYADGLAPLVRFDSLTDAPSERLITHEGEYAAVAATATGALAVVVGDYHYARLDVAVDGTAGVDARALARELAARVSMGLGVRRRRVWFAPPAGWLGLARGLASDWFAPTPPRGATVLRVYPATPARLLPDEVAAAIVDEQRLGGEPVEVAGHTPTAHGLVLHTRVAAGWRDWAIDRVGGYQYTVRLETLTDELRAAARPVFDAVVASIERVPGPRGNAPAVLDHWLE